jgi:uncharacterized membrane protein YhaH (DUF805 family)
MMLYETNADNEKARRVRHLFWDVLLIALLIAMLVHIILLIVRLDLYIDISYFMISLPAFVISTVGSSIGLLYTLYYGLSSDVARAHDSNMLMRGIILLSMSQAFFWTHFNLARKFEHVTDMLYVTAMIPFITFSLIALVTLLVLTVRKGRSVKKD